MNVDTQEFLYLRGQLSGLALAVAELAKQQDIAQDINATLDRIEALMTGDPVLRRPPLRVLEGGGRSGGHHRRPRLTVVREAQ